MSDWQPIETAPTDGTEFDVWVPSDAGGYRVTNLHLRGDRGYLWDQGLSIARIARWPTHWMPLPAPPEVSHAS